MFIQTVKHFSPRHPQNSEDESSIVGIYVAPAERDYALRYHLFEITYLDRFGDSPRRRKANVIRTIDHGHTLRGIQRDRSSKYSSRRYPPAGHNHFGSQDSDPGNNHRNNRHRSERGKRIPDSDIFFSLLPSYPLFFLAADNADASVVMEILLPTWGHSVNNPSSKSRRF
jgi:hypothetical protein